MSLYINGMEMPESCFNCPFMYARTLCAANHKIQFDDEDYTELKGRYIGCPLIEIPPHGRLIDAEAMEKSLVAQIEQCTRLLESLECVDNLREFESQREVLKEILEEINFALTVIPADKEE